MEADYKKSHYGIGGKRRIVVIAMIAMLIIAVRLSYYTGPIFANTQDEGIYYSQIASNVIFKNPISFSQYRNANFSNVTSGLFNPAEAFQFYVGLLYPIIFMARLFGFSASLPIAYVMLTSVVEGVFIFFIIEKISGARAAVIGGVLFAFLPVDVLFSDQLQPLVPAAMALAISVYVFISAGEVFAKKKQKASTWLCLYAVAGFFIGVSYITNPIGISMLIFLALVVIAGMIIEREAKHHLGMLLMMVIGFAIAYSMIGILFFAQSGNYLLFPMVDSAIYKYQLATQPVLNQTIAKTITLQYTVGPVASYVPVIFDFPMSFYLPYLRYFGVFGYALISMAIIALNPGSRNRYAFFFVSMFAFLFLEISAAPTLISFKNGMLYLNLVPHLPYVMVILGLPMIVVIALGLETIISGGSRYSKYAVVVIMAVILISANLDLLRDTSYYNASTFTLHRFVDFVQQQPGSVFYAEWLFAGNANLLTGYRYNVEPLSNCSYAYLAALNTTYIALGGTISLDISPYTITSFDSCAEPNITTDYRLVYYSGNPLSYYNDYGPTPQLEIYQKIAR